MIELDDAKFETSEPVLKAPSYERVAARGDETAVGGSGSINALHASVSGTPDVTFPETQSQSCIKPLVLQPDFDASGKEQYHVEELLRYHDRHFIENVYQAILGRNPFDAERVRELDELRSGRASKVEIIERLLSSQERESGVQRVRVEGLPSPVVRRLSRVPVLGYVLRIGRALLRLPVLMQHQQQFEIYTLAQHQLIADHINQAFARAAQASAVESATPLSIALQSQIKDLIETVTMFSDALLDLSNSHTDLQAQNNDLIETVKMFSDALLDLSNDHADLQAQTQTQVKQTEAALTDLTQAMIGQQEITETLRREQQTVADAQQEFLIQEQHVIIETQKIVLEELREELRELAHRQQHAREEFSAQVHRLQSLLEASRQNFSGQS
jgi:hypothetical protein